jgi:hypothetical protein
MRNAARLKMGYYSLPECEALRLRSLLSYSDPASAIDPCGGQGTALELVTREALVNAMVFFKDDDDDTLLFEKLQEHVLERYPNPERKGCIDHSTQETLSTLPKIGPLRSQVSPRSQMRGMYA